MGPSLAKNRAIQLGVGVLSILFGSFLLYQIGFVEELFW